MASMKRSASAATEGPWAWKRADQGPLLPYSKRDGGSSWHLGTLISESTGLAIAHFPQISEADSACYCKSFPAVSPPSTVDAEFMAEATPTNILRLVARLKRAQVTPSSGTCCAHKLSLHLIIYIHIHTFTYIYIHTYISEIKRAQVIPASPLFIKPLSPLAASLERTARASPFGRRVWEEEEDHVEMRRRRKAARFDNVVCRACCFRCFLLSEYLSPARRPAPPPPSSLSESLSPARRPAAAVLGRRIRPLRLKFLKWIRIS
jgi:hypothetical protein